MLATAGFRLSRLRLQRCVACREARKFSAEKPRRAVDPTDANKSVAYYLAGMVTLVVGLSYGSVPLYKVFCQMTGTRS
jgi:cytochrome c oxidase assembly protein Cox11